MLPDIRRHIRPKPAPKPDTIMPAVHADDVHEVAYRNLRINSSVLMSVI